MMIGRCCRCLGPAVTIKGIDAADGVTIWEYGPGSWWRQHYGLNAISGIVPNLGVSLSQYIIEAHAGLTEILSGLRSGPGLEANAEEALTLTKLDALDGTVIESALMSGMFVRSINDQGYSTTLGITINEAAGLSGGDYVVVGKRVPIIEFVDFADNLVDKTYILHAHNQQAGNVYIKTRTSSETITLAYNASAAAVETAFEATADCVAATATGGPWPLLPITIDVEWSVSSGDIKSIATDETTSVGYTIGTGSCTFAWTGGVEWTLEEDNCTTGVATEPNEDGTEPAEVQPGTCRIPGGTNRSVNGVAASYDTGTGLMVTSVGQVFGRDQDYVPDKLMARAGTVPDFFTAAAARIGQIASGENDRVAIVPIQGDQSVANAVSTLEAWTVGNPWSREWQYFTNTGAVNSGTVEFLHVEDNTACVSFARVAFTGGNRCAATVSVGAGSITEIDQPVVSTSATDRENEAITKLSDSSSSETTVTAYERNYRDAEYSGIHFKFDFEGSEVAVDGDELRLGAHPGLIGVNASYVYSRSSAGSSLINYGPPDRVPSGIAGADAKEYYWKFYAGVGSRLKAPTQWRFRFSGSTAILFTSWIDWFCTATDIKNAIETVFPETTWGPGYTNADVYPFGEPSAILNPDFSPLEQGLDIIFGGASTPTGLAAGWIAPSFLRVNKITIEVQNRTSFNILGFGAWSRTDASILWQRTFGVSSTNGLTVAQPLQAWLRGDWVYAAGLLVEAEI